ncbi:acetate--CoA ligase family protein [Blastococcus mobilis]|uniref:Acyl-CoA synthetase (NDP forming) n=1 Tax=Blastococcus mobilis TaxID=1938746 RepID=A0A238Y2M3_9ACTN|nr:acetate--CoA ligase family protein [Blastococcus mobilis]SNR65260.1 Acyl-CoA synthetase (NDP forming) [Blastococcus mobilis]
MNSASYEAFMQPRSVAIIGASDDGQKTGGRTLRYLDKYGYEGEVHPINPRRPTVQGKQAYPDLTAVGRPVDLAVIVTPAEHSVAALESCVAAEVPAVIMISSGFAELNAEGAQRQRELEAVLRGSSTRVLGPNCVGLVSVRSRLAATINTGMDQDRFDLRDGGIAFLTQSGAMGAFVFNMSQTRRVGLGSLISTGNEMDISFPEMMHALLDDPKVTGVAGYIEGIRDGEAFAGALRHAQEVGKPLAFLKVGRSPLGVEAIASHTGALAGTDAVYTGVFEQYGVTRIWGVEALADWAQMVDLARPPAGNRLSVTTTSGGGGVLVADHCTDLGISMATWEGEWQQKLAGALPEYLSARNPIDMAGTGGSSEALREVLALMGEHPGTDVAMVLIGNLDKEEDPLIEVLDEAHRSMDKPLVVVWVGGSGRPVVELTSRGVPAYTDPGRALQALSGLMAAHRAAGRPPAAAPPVDTGRRAQARALLAEARQAGLGVLDEFRAKKLLGLYGVPVVQEAVAQDPDHAAAEAAWLGFPVAVKLLADDVAHKSELGGVLLGLSSADEVSVAAKDMLARLPREVAEGARLLVQPMVAPGLEMLLGIKRDEAFGPVLVLGLGGTWTEVLEDVQLRLPPVSPEDVTDALSRLRSARLLGPFRGAPARDQEAVVAAAQALAELALELGDEIAELDINPLIVGARGDGACAVDAVVIPRAAAVPSDH